MAAIRYFHGNAGMVNALILPSGATAYQIVRMAVMKPRWNVFHFNVQTLNFAVRMVGALRRMPSAMASKIVPTIRTN